MEKYGPLVALDDLDKNGNLVNLDENEDGNMVEIDLDGDELVKLDMAFDGTSYA